MLRSSVMYSTLQRHVNTSFFTRVLCEMSCGPSNTHCARGGGLRVASGDPASRKTPTGPARFPPHDTSHSHPLAEECPPHDYGLLTMRRTTSDISPSSICSRRYSTVFTMSRISFSFLPAGSWILDCYARVSAHMHWTCYGTRWGATNRCGAY